MNIDKDRDKEYAEMLKKKVQSIRDGTEKYPSLTKIIIEIHEKE